MPDGKTTRRGREWWVDYPQVWHAEAAAFTAAGASWSTEPADHHSWEDVHPAGEVPAGLGFPVRVSRPHPDPAPGDPDVLDLRVRYGAHFPWLPARVLLPEPLPGLARHRHPLTGDLCLLGRPDDWHLGLTVAGLLTRQLPGLLGAGRPSHRTGSAAVTVPEIGAETLAQRVPLGAEPVLVDGAWRIPTGLRYGTAWLVPVGPDSSRTPYAVETVFDEAGVRVAEQTGQWPDRPGLPTVWMRLPVLPADGVLAGSVLWKLAEAELHTRLDLPVDEDGNELLLLLAPDDTAPSGEDWLLLRRHTGKPAEEFSVRAGGDIQQRFGSYCATGHSYRIGPSDMLARLPGAAASRLPNAKVAVVGIGAIGSTVAFELARAGVGRLRLVDGDEVDPATSCRQLPGVWQAGEAKVRAVRDLILASTPHARVEAVPLMLDGGDPDELARLLQYDLVIDATASPLITRLLTAHARLSGTPVLVATATAGGWGGTILALPAAGGGCYECLQLHRADNFVRRPPADPAGGVLPAGCSDPTYIGGAAELGAVALQAVRNAIDILTRPAAGQSGYGDFQVLSQHDESGPTLPTWQAVGLPPHAGCPLHEHGRPGQSAAAFGAWT
jgi:hypothetical protein